MKKTTNDLYLSRHQWNSSVIRNHTNLKTQRLYIPVLFLFAIALCIGIVHAFSIDVYIDIQKEWFFYLNSELSKSPVLQANLTQLGDVVVFLPFLALFMVYAPRFWQSLLTALVVSCLLSNILKRLFSVPRPAGVFDHDSFVIIGETLSGNTSLPSGHSIATFTILTCLFYAFMPKTRYLKMIWFFVIFGLGSMMALSRVGVGAHYPIDVVIGSVIGYICALIGIFANERFTLFTWITTKKYYPISIVLFAIGVLALVEKIAFTNLIVCYLSLIALVAAIFIITSVYAKGQG